MIVSRQEKNKRKSTVNGMRSNTVKPVVKIGLMSAGFIGRAPGDSSQGKDQCMSFMGAVMEGIFTVSDDASVGYASLLKKLHGSSYSDWLVMEAEQAPQKANPLICATMGCRNLAKLAKDAGFTVNPVRA